jgi:SAM-dependent methyltransferase
MSEIKTAIRDSYAAMARGGLSNEDEGVRAVAQAFGYTPDELAAIPAESNMGLSCGNPTAFASLKPGEVVVDLGCGGGLDVFLAARKVGPTGRAIGIDMTPAMIDRARKAAAGEGGRAPIANVEFYLAEIDKIPLKDASVDCVISNCVINLAPNKPAVFREIARILKPGGRLAISDIALRQPLPAELSQSIAALVGCISGAMMMYDYAQLLTEAGFSGVKVMDAGKDLNAYALVDNQSGCCSPPTKSSTLPIADCGGHGCGCSGEAAPEALHGQLAALLEKYDINAYAAGAEVYARK